AVTASASHRRVSAVCRASGGRRFPLLCLELGHRACSSWANESRGLPTIGQRAALCLRVVVRAGRRVRVVRGRVIACPRLVVVRSGSASVFGTGVLPVCRRGGWGYVFIVAPRCGKPSVDDCSPNDERVAAG